MKNIVLALVLMFSVGCAGHISQEKFMKVVDQKQQQAQMLRGVIERCEQQNADLSTKLKEANTPSPQERAMASHFQAFITTVWAPGLAEALAEAAGSHINLELGEFFFLDNYSVAVLAVKITGATEKTVNAYGVFVRDARLGWVPMGVHMLVDGMPLMPQLEEQEERIGDTVKFDPHQQLEL